MFYLQQELRKDALKCRMALLKSDLEKVKNYRELIVDEIENNETDLEKAIRKIMNLKQMITTVKDILTA